MLETPMTTTNPILHCNSLGKQFRIKDGLAASSALLTAVDNVSLSIESGKTVGIAGESGCGKSTLGKILAGLLKPDRGEVCYQGKAITKLNPTERHAFRLRTQMIFQDPFSSLNPRMRIGDTIAEPLLLAGMKDGAARRAKVAEIMQKTGLSPSLQNRFPHEFSGGQRQRIGIARALAASPEILIADEPVSSLDISIQAQIINLLQEMKEAFSLSMLIISHDLSVLRHVCDRVNIMYLGIIVESAPAAELFENGCHPYTEALISAIPSINHSRNQKQALLMDDLPSPLAIPSGCRFHTRCRHAAEICRTTAPPLQDRRPDHQVACHFPLEAN
jgi:peptide/nickel transport system ATP-binding protein